MKFKIILFIVSSTIFVSQSNAQIFQTKAEIIKKEGTDYNTGVSDQGIEFISYYKPKESESSGKFTQAKAYYFFERDGVEICNRYIIFEPSSETNSNVAMMKKSGLVEIDYMQWKDYENDILYIISVNDGYCKFDAMWNHDL